MCVCIWSAILCPMIYSIRLKPSYKWNHCSPIPAYMERMKKILHYLTTSNTLHMVTCNQSEKSDVMMDKSKYFYEFVKLRVVNVIFMYGWSFIFGHPANKFSHNGCILPHVRMLEGKISIESVPDPLFVICRPSYKTMMASNIYITACYDIVIHSYLVFVETCCVFLVSW